MKTLTILAVLAMATITGCNDDTDSSQGSDDVGIESLGSVSGDEVDERYGLTGDQIDEGFASFLRMQHPTAFGPLPDETIIDLGRGACEAFDSGASFETLASATITSGYTMQEGATLIGAAIEAYCPEYSGLLG